MSDIASVRHLAVVGVGLLGASLGLALKRRGFAGRITGVARSQATLDQARAVGAIDAGTLEIEHAVRDAQLVVVAVPLGAFDETFEALARHAPQDAVITDVGSTKLSVQRAAA